MSVWGWWAFDIFTLIASYLAIEIVAAQTILRSIGLITFMLPVGISSACNTLVGNSVGEGSSYKAVLYYNTCMVLSVILAIIQVILLVSLKDLWVLLFTDQELIAA
jgi:multidrug resistance protein, MATE family